MALECGLVEVRKLGTGSRELSKVSVHGQRPYAADCGTHGWDVLKGCCCCFGL